MNVIARKLQSNSGASIIMALVLVLVAVVTSAVILSAATSSALLVQEDKEAQQAYLTVSSAAELMRDELEAGKCNYTATTTQAYSRTYSWRTGWSDWTKNGDPTTTYKFGDDSALFVGIMKDAMDYITTYGTTFQKEYSIEASGFDNVGIEVLMNKKSSSTSSEGAGNYSLTVTFTGGADSHECRMQLTMEGVADTSTTSSEDYWGYSKTEVTTTTVEWKNPIIQRKEVS